MSKGLSVETLRVIEETNRESEGAGAAAPAPLPLLEEGTQPRAEELPEGAVASAAGVELRLRYPAATKFRRGDGSVREERFERLSFRRLTGKDLIAMGAAEANRVGVVALGLALGIGEGRAGLLFDAMDATDCAAALRVIGFLSGSGQPTGR
ncbi:MAG: hypothetical protein M0002_08150 [Rhodospirillales bacterium]|nr:hypothetical protein [Rhodospirillales bacterium]